MNLTATKTVLVTKFTLLLLLIACLQGFARGYSQQVTLNVRNATLDQVFKSIRKQTNYLFVYDLQILREAKRVDLNVKNAGIIRVLDSCFKDQPFTYTIFDNTIVVKTKDHPAQKDLPLNDLLLRPDNMLAFLSGTVRDEEGKPLQGVSVSVKNTKKGATTDEQGNYSIVAEKGDILLFSYVGYKIQSVRIKDAITVNIILVKTVEALNATVVTGYSTKTIGEITGSVQKVSGEVIRTGVTGSDVSSMLQGKVTGLYITNQSEGDPTNKGGGIVLRGPSSVATIGTDKYNDYVLPSTIYSPLIVLDGVIMPRETSPGQATTLKDVVNPEDIAEVTILKDASSTAIYGSRASAGVIVIVTRKGKSDGLHLNLDLKYGSNVPNRGNIRFLSGPELYNYQKQYFTQNWQTNGTGLGYPTEDAYLTAMLPSYSQVQDSSFDYQQYGFTHSHTSQVNLSASGGNEKTRYYMNAGYYHEQSTGINNELARKTFRVNIDNNFSKRVSFGISLNGIFDDGTRDNTGFGASIYQLFPWVYPYNANGTPKPELDFTSGGFPSATNNFLFDKQYNWDRLRNQQLFGSLKITLNITDWLSASSTNSFNVGNYNEKIYTDARTYFGYAFGANGGLTANSTYYNSVLTSNQLTFHKKIGDHNLRFMAAQEYGTNNNENQGVVVNNIKPGYSDISLAQNIGSLYGYNTGQKIGNVTGDIFNGLIFSVFGEAGYSYKDKYFASGSVRTDASTNFGKDKRYGTFYSGGLSWLINKEDFLSAGKTINLLKLRANYGTNGSQNGNNFFTQTLYNPGGQYNGQSAAVISSLANSNIGWETTQTFDAGVEFGIFDNRISGSIDYYDRRSIGLIQKVQLTAAIGFPVQFQNTANVQNKGAELLLNTINIRSRDFTWSTNFNLTYNKNQLLKTYGDSLYTGAQVIPGYYLFKGEDINTQKGIKEVGIDPQTGNAQYQKLLFDAKGNVSGTQIVNSISEVLADNASRQYQKLGSLQPKFFGGLTNTFTYKNFSLSALIYFQLGNIYFNQWKFDFQMNSVSSYNQIAYIKGQTLWTNPGQKNATEPSLYSQGNSDWWNSFNSHFYDKGDFAKLRNVRLSYDLSARLLKKLSMSRMQVYMSGDNLFSVTHKGFLGSDPSGVFAGDAFQQQSGGVGFGLGTPRKYLLGIEVTF